MAESDANLGGREASSRKSRCFDSVFSFKGMKVSVQRISQVNRHCSNEMKYLICKVIYKKKNISIRRNGQLYDHRYHLQHVSYRHLLINIYRLDIFNSFQRHCRYFLHGKFRILAWLHPLYTLTSGIYRSLKSWKGPPKIIRSNLPWEKGAWMRLYSL